MRCRIAETNVRKVAHPLPEHYHTFLLFKHVAQLVHAVGHDVIVAFQRGRGEPSDPRMAPLGVLFRILNADHENVGFAQRSADVCYC